MYTVLEAADRAGAAGANAFIKTTLGGLTDFGFKTSGGGRFSYMADNIILLRADVTDRITRTCSILKERASSHDLHLNEFEITAKGVRIKNSE